MEAFDFSNANISTVRYDANEVWCLWHHIYRMWKDPTQQQKMEPVVQIISAASCCSKMMITEAIHIIVADSIVQPEHANKCCWRSSAHWSRAIFHLHEYAIRMPNQIKERPTQKATFSFSTPNVQWSLSEGFTKCLHLCILMYVYCGHNLHITLY